MDISLLWIPATLIAAAAQTARNTMQHRLTETLGTVGAAQVRFLYGFPFALLFLLVNAVAGGQQVPAPNASFLAFVAGGAVTQVIGTVLMLATMQLRSFALSTVYVKTEPVQLAIFAVAVLGDPLTPLGALAVLTATAGVITMSLKPGAGSLAGGGWQAPLLGIASGAFFALSTVGFRGAILALETGTPLIRSSTALVWSLAMQTLMLVVVLGVFRRDALVGSLRVWRSSLTAGFMGAFASQCWFIGFALTVAINVRTLGLIEVLFAQMVSRRFFAQTTSAREKIGAALVIAGLLLLVAGPGH
ncbi:EamA family transporter [Pigmentiphaga soli]|uniref:EamA family transporter n=1 Tax=Pigmentiphaga soli TaxID=1007095 RepID=A0ABP8H7I9_9BURK